MVKLILLIVGAVVILVGTLLFSKKLPRARYRYWDFISLAAVVLGAFAFINLLGPAGTKPEINDTLTKVLHVVFPVVTVLFLVIYLVFLFLKGGIHSIVADDERTEISQTKSARNALLATNLALFIYLGSSQTLNRNGLLIVLFSGYIVYLSSALFYYFWKA
jgi:hypothetical protein